MSSSLPELYRHQAWADAEHWRTFMAFPSCLDDPAIRRRLHHIHLVERAFLSIVRGMPLAITEPGDFPAAADLRAYAREYHREAIGYIDTIPPARLEERLVIPWFNDPPIRITVEQAMTHAAMHSHYHRAQNATRLRELGGNPPLTDLILWYWREKPEADWGD